MKFTIIVAALLGLTAAQDPVALEWEAQTSCAEEACATEGDCCGSSEADADGNVTAVEKFCAASDTTKISWTKDGESYEVAFACDAVEEGASAIKTTIAGLALATAYYMA